MRNVLLFGLLSALLGFTSACHKFDNPVEAANLGRSSGLVKATIDGIDPQATVLGVDLHWNENGAAREIVFHKLVALSGADKKLVVSFDGLGGGLGYVEAGSYVGQTPWQAPVRGDTLMISGTGVGLSKILLGFVDGDADLDFDLDRDFAGDADTAPDGDDDSPQSDGDTSENEAEQEAVGPWEAAALLNVPYSPTTPLLDGTVDADSEWKDAGIAIVTTGVSDPTLLFVKHNTQALYLAMILPGQATANGETELDRAVLGFDVGETPGNDAYAIEITRGGSLSCTLLKGGSRGCNGLSPRPDYIVKTSELADGQGFMFEMTLPFSALGLESGLPKVIRFAAFFFDNSATSYYSWPAGSASPTSVYGWAGLHSLNNWSFGETDGDAN